MLAMKQNTVREPYHHSQTQTTTRSSTTTRSKRNLAVVWERASVMACIGVCAVVFWVIAANGGRISAMNYNIDKMQTQVQKASAENASLTTRVDELQKPERILQVAINQLHMQYGTPVQIQAASQVKH